MPIPTVEVVPNDARAGRARAGRRSISALVFGVVFVLWSTVAASVTPVSAQARSYEIEEFHSTVRVRTDGRLEVLERIRFGFEGAYNGIYRTIPVEYREPSGGRRRIHLDVQSVVDETGSALRWEESREGAYRRLQVWIPGAEDASRTVEIRYMVVGGVRFFDEGAAQGFGEAHDELYWNVTGDEWSVPIRSASALVELPPGVRGSQATAYTGPYGSRENRGEIQELEDGFQFLVDDGLGPGEGLTVVVGWEPGVVERPGPLIRAGILFRAHWILILPILVAVLMGRLWHTRGRDPTRRPIAPWYEPPEGLTPAEVGTLVDGRPNTRDIVSTMVDLAVRGYLRIEEIEKNPLHELVSGADYRLHRTRDFEDWTVLEDHERELLAGLFGASGDKASVELSELENHFYEHLSDIKDGIFDRLLDLGLYDRRPDRVRRTYTIIGAGVIGAGAPGAVFLADALLLSPLSAVAAAVATGLIVLVVGWFMPVRTKRGARKLEEVLGFQEFLERVEEDRFKRMITSPDQFEAYLPYAMALGVDATWARAFADMVREPPDWYTGRYTGPFHPTAFAESLDQMGSRSGSVLTSSPRSASGGSGFSGGGFSGGGVGGGGGGAF